MYWRIVSHLWNYLPIGEEVSYTRRIFGSLLLLSVAFICAGYLRRHRSLVRFGAGLGIGILVLWPCLYFARPAWLRIAGRSAISTPTFDPITWTRRAAGLETAEVDLRVNGEFPLTPLRMTGKPAGPAEYQSDHGAFVADGKNAGIIDLRHRDVIKTIGSYPEAMVSYPLLIDPDGQNRAAESRVWLASRNFVGIDEAGRIVMGTTQTGFFTLHRLGDFLKSAPLGLRVALNLDGGPLVSQVVHAGGFTRQFHGKAEMTDDTDVLRALWHAHIDPPSPLPIVLVAVPVVP